jgi:hypothetical protein
MGWIDNLVSCVVHPCVGIAHVGNAPDEYFIGAEAPGLASMPPGSTFKDSAGRIKRQAARLLIFGVDANGQVLGPR